MRALDALLAQMISEFQYLIDVVRCPFGGVFDDGKTVRGYRHAQALFVSDVFRKTIVA